MTLILVLRTGGSIHVLSNFKGPGTSEDNTMGSVLDRKCSLRTQAGDDFKVRSASATGGRSFPGELLAEVPRKGQEKADSIPNNLLVYASAGSRVLSPRLGMRTVHTLQWTHTYTQQVTETGELRKQSGAYRSAGCTESRAWGRRPRQPPVRVDKVGGLPWQPWPACSASCRKTDMRLQKERKKPQVTCHRRVGLGFLLLGGTEGPRPGSGNHTRTLPWGWQGSALTPRVAQVAHI